MHLFDLFRCCYRFYLHLLNITEKLCIVHAHYIELVKLLDGKLYTKYIKSLWGNCFPPKYYTVVHYLK